MLTQFLGTAPGAAPTPPVDAYGNPIVAPATGPSAGASAGSSAGSSTGSSAGSSPGTSYGSPVPSYDPTVCSPRSSVA